MTAQPAISIWSSEDGRRCIPPYIRIDELAYLFDWLNLSPETWAKIKVAGIPPNIERELEIRFRVLESFRQSQKLASLAARNLESHHYEENDNPDYEFASDQSEPNDYDESIDHLGFTSKSSLQAAIEKIESPRRTRTLIAAMLDDLRIPRIDCDPIKSYGLHDEILRLLCARSTNANSIAAKELVFCLLQDAELYRKNGKANLALELEFLASAIDLIAYRKKERTAHAKKLWF